MKILGTLFLVIGLVCAFLGWSKTDEGSLLALQENIAREQLTTAKQGQTVLEAIAAGDSRKLIGIDDRELIKAALDDIHRGATPSRGQLANATLEVTAKEQALRTAIEERADTAKWYYVPAACLCVIGLILLMIPTSRR